jgi:hypothetical protein
MDVRLYRLRRYRLLILLVGNAIAFLSYWLETSAFVVFFLLLLFLPTPSSFPPRDLFCATTQEADTVARRYPSRKAEIIGIPKMFFLNWVF